MQICIAGWHYNQKLFELMDVVKKRHPVFIVAHREGDCNGFPMEVIENIGLEFHIYDHFLMNKWDGTSNILFMHDDIEWNPVLVNNEIIMPTNVFNKIDGFNIDQGYVFQSPDDAQWNAMKHGRMIFMSAKLAKRLKDSGGIWYDRDNHGVTTSGPYNAGIVTFHEMMVSFSNQFDTCNIIFAPMLEFLRRAGDKTFYGNQVTMEGLKNVSCR